MRAQQGSRNSFVDSGGGSKGRVLHGPRTAIPGEQAPEHWVLGDTSQESAVTLGHLEAGRTQNRNSVPATGWPQAVQISAPPPMEDPGPCSLGAVIVQELTQG